MSKIKTCFSVLYLLLCPILSFILLEYYTHDPFETMTAVPLLLNIALFELLSLFLLMLTGSSRICLLLLLLFCSLYGLANYFVLEFRGAPIQPWDILSVTTAASVADNYEYKLNADTLKVLAGFAVLLLLALMTNIRLRSLRIRLAVLCVSGLAVFGYTRMLDSETIVEKKLHLYNKLFTPTAIQYKNGTLTAFLLQLQYVSVQKPAGYDADDAQKLLESYKALSDTGTGLAAAVPSADSDTAAVSGKYPNIIVIMNEAFSDPAVLGEFTTNKDYMPFVHSMLNGAENTVSGHMSVSVKGGNTANTEFEFLTGSTMAFLPFGSVPYQQYVQDKMPTLASHLSSLGYRTVAMHPYAASGWERDEVYPAFGFDSSYFIDFYKDAPRIRKYVSDEGDYQKLIQIYEEKKAGQPLFLFNITMQNHSSYSDWNKYANFTPDIQVEGSSSKLLPAYLSLISLSDQAIEKLVNYFENQPEETVLVFFGDHQPADSVVNPVLALHSKHSSSLSEEDEAARYQVPFFIWANFDIAEESGLMTSANFLAVKTLQTAKLPLTDYFAFLAQQKQQTPVVSAGCVLLPDGTLTDPREQKDLLNTYQTLQYYQIFDRNDKE